MAGLACAERLVDGGRSVVLFDKGRGPGGRMSTRRAATSLGEATFDHGAQYFTIRDEAFRRRAARWIAAGTAAPWPAAGPDAYVGAPGMNAPVRQMAEGLDVRWSSRVHALSPDPSGWRLMVEQGQCTSLQGPFDAVVLALPAEQAAPLIETHDEALASAARGMRTAPCWTAMAAFGARLPTAADVFKTDPVVGWAARNRSKPLRAGPETWVIQGSPDWSAATLEAAPEVAARALLAAFFRLAAVEDEEPIHLSAHRWRFARSGTFGAPYLWNKGIGLCGDWLLGPRVECAFLSGDALGGAILGVVAN